MHRKVFFNTEVSFIQSVLFSLYKYLGGYIQIASKLYPHPPSPSSPFLLRCLWYTKRFASVRTCCRGNTRGSLSSGCRRPLSHLSTLTKTHVDTPCLLTGQTSSNITGGLVDTSSLSIFYILFILSVPYSDWTDPTSMLIP